jgi:hypothetical protein
MKRALALTVFLLLSACATVEVGRGFDLAGFEAKVVPGVTTKADVRAWLGVPAGIGTSVETSGERLQQWIYYNGNGHFPRMTDAHFRMLQIRFDERGVVRSYSSSS